VSSIVGIIAAGIGLRSALQDKTALRISNKNGVLAILAGERLWRNLASLYIHGIFAVVGVAAIVSVAATEVSIFGVLFTLCNVALVSVNVTEQHHRTLINRMLG
jgi:hypothetical protein